MLQHIPARDIEQKRGWAGQAVPLLLLCMYNLHGEAEVQMSAMRALYNFCLGDTQCKALARYLAQGPLCTWSWGARPPTDAAFLYCLPYCALLPRPSPVSTTTATWTATTSSSGATTWCVPNKC